MLTEPVPTAEPQFTRERPTRFREVLRRIRFLTAAALGSVVVGIAIVGQFATPYDPRLVVAASDLPPSATHWFGTDSAGLDVFSRVVAATGTDLLIGLIAALLATSLGIVLGLLLGMNESRPGVLGAVCRGLTRTLDVFQALPTIIVGLVLLGLFGTSPLSLGLVIAVVIMPDQARVVRTEVLKIRTEAYLDAAQLAGETKFSTVFRHVLPNSAWPALENASWNFGTAILIAAGLGFLGVGLPPPTPEWGAMIAADATGVASGRWWAPLFPSVMLALTVLLANRVGSQYLSKNL